MSGIYIPGLRVPEENEDELWIAVRPDGTVTFNAEWGWTMNKDKAISVPEHGRLGDLDDFAKRMKNLVEKAENDGFDLGAAWYSAFVRHIELTPTIIPADPAEEVEG